MKPYRFLAPFAALALAAVATTAAAQQAARKPYIVQLADAPAASYTGGIAGMKATRPATGNKLDVRAPEVQAYIGHLNRKQANVAATVPSARVTHRYETVLNGFSAWLTDAEVQKLASDPSVRKISIDQAQPLRTNYTPGFLGVSAPGGAWSRLDAAGRAVKGENVIIGHIDGGVWPENPSVSDKVDPVTGKPVASHLPGTVVYPPLPAGRYRGICQASAGGSGASFTAANCNNKLVGARYFNSTWKLAESLGIVATHPTEYLDSPRDGEGHGSHTLTTSGGNQNVDVVVNGTAISNISGIAPRARIAAYKSCYMSTDAGGAPTQGSCFNSDSVAAIEAAVKDGVDVINYSIGGSQTSYTDAVETAFANASFAGVFVAASAGNDGPANTLEHVSPWITTVGNSTHDRFTVATVTLGNGATATGPSFQLAGVPSKPLILAADAGVAPYASLSDTDKAALARCFGPGDRADPTLNVGNVAATAAAALDPAKAAGRIVVCYRGGNVLVNKTASVKAAGGAAAVIQNLPAGFAPVPPSTNTTFNIAHVVPTVHLTADFAQAIIAYAAAANATASFSGGVQVPGVVAPQMNAGSSRGPNRGDADILKPDITAPGTDIIAAYTNTSITPEQKAQIIAGTLIPGPGADMISGTSMSSPHVAGAAALLKQANPKWSPFAIKSALMTSAQQTLKLANGAADLDRWGYGAGHLNPTGALDTRWVYDSSVADYVDYYFGDVAGGDLNLASLTRAQVPGIGKITRTLTNNGSGAATYSASASVPGFTVAVSPASLTLAPGASASFDVTVTRTSAPVETWAFGHVTWTGDGRSLRSPLSVKGSLLVAPASLTDTRWVGVKVFTVATGYDGSLHLAPTGMVKATRKDGRVTTGNQVCYPIAVAAGAKVLRVQLFNSDTEGGDASDLDLSLYFGNDFIGGSFTASSDELVSFDNPPPGAYTACVEGYAPLNDSAAFTLSHWVVGPASGRQSLQAFGQRKVKLGGSATVGMVWITAPNARHLGVVEYRSDPKGEPIAATQLFVDGVKSDAAAVASVGSGSASVQSAKQLR